MQSELNDLVTTYNEAVDRYNLARLEYAMSFEGFVIPPVARAMPIGDIDRADRHTRPRCPCKPYETSSKGYSTASSSQTR